MSRPGILPRRKVVPGSTGWLATLRPVPHSILVMEKDFAERARERQARWQGGVARTHEEMAEEDLRFWRNATPSQRLEAVWQMALEAWVLKGAHGPAPRLQGSPVGIRRKAG